MFLNNSVISYRATSCFGGARKSMLPTIIRASPDISHTGGEYISCDAMNGCSGILVHILVAFHDNRIL